MNVIKTKIMKVCIIAQFVRVNVMRHKKFLIKKIRNYLSLTEFIKLKYDIFMEDLNLEFKSNNVSFLIAESNLWPQIKSNSDYYKKINKRIEEDYNSELILDFSNRAKFVISEYLATDLIISRKTKEKIAESILKNKSIYLLTSSKKAEKIIKSIHSFRKIKIDYGNSKKKGFDTYIKLEKEDLGKYKEEAKNNIAKVRVNQDDIKFIKKYLSKL